MFLSFYSIKFHLIEEILRQFKTFALNNVFFHLYSKLELYNKYKGEQ